MFMIIVLMSPVSPVLHTVVTVSIGLKTAICVYDENPIGGRDIQYRAPDSRSEYTTPFDDILIE